MSTPEAKTKLDFLREKVLNSAAAYNRRWRSNACLGSIIKFLILFLTATVTIILGLNLEPTVFYNRIALCTSALVSVVSGVAAFFDFSDLSIKYKEAVDRLERLSIRIHYLDLSSVFDEKSVSLLKDTYLEILKETHDFYQKFRQDDVDRTT